MTTILVDHTMEAAALLWGIIAVFHTERAYLTQTLGSTKSLASP
jgi:hypothetical protein